MGEMAFSEKTPREVVARNLTTLFDAPREVTLSDLEACDRWGAEGRLAALQAPLTVLVGKDDMLTPPRLGRRLVDRVPGARLEVLEKTGHMVPQERPDVVGRELMRQSMRL
jgi:pimeloyl-ACP methyl ester carboxylesterase